MSRVKPKARVSGAKAAIRPASLDVRRAMAGFDSITMVADEFRDTVAEQAPDLMWRLPPKKPPARSTRRRLRRRDAG